MGDADSAKKRREFAKHYAAMMDGELEELARGGGGLTALAREALREEISRRGLAAEVKEPGSETPGPEWRKPVTVRVFRDLPEAQLARTILESANMPCFLADENTVRMDWFYSNAIGGIKLWVNEEDAEAATALLDAEIPSEFAVEGVGEYTQPSCPRCKSLDISYEDLDKRTTFAALFAFKFPIPFKRRRWNCNACGHEWEGESEEGARSNS